MANFLDGSGPIRVLIFEFVTGGGLATEPLPPSLAAEGASIRRALVADFAAVPGVLVIETIDGRCVDPHELPNVRQIIADPGHLIDLGRLAGSVDLVLLVAPETNACLADLDRTVVWSGGRSMGSAGRGLLMGTNKLRLADHLGRIGVPTPPTTAFGPSDNWPVIHSPTGRIVVKPVDGAGSVDTFILPHQAPCPAVWQDRSGGIVQPYYPGIALSASFLIDRDGHAFLLAVGRQQIEQGKNGKVAYRGGTVPVPCTEAHLTPVRRAVESISDLFGFVGVDFILDEPTGTVEVIEINPRVTTSIVGLVQLAPPGTIARAWLNLVEPDDRFDMAGELGKIATAPPVWFGADGSIVCGPKGRP